MKTRDIIYNNLWNSRNSQGIASVDTDKLIAITGISKAALSNHLGALCRRKIIELHKRGGGRYGYKSEYVVNSREAKILTKNIQETELSLGIGPSLDDLRYEVFHVIQKLWTKVTTLSNENERYKEQLDISNQKLGTYDKIQKLMEVQYGSKN